MSESPLLSPCGWELSSGGSCLRPMPLGKGWGPWGGGEHPQRRVKEPEKLEVLSGDSVRPSRPGAGRSCRLGPRQEPGQRVAQQRRFLKATRGPSPQRARAWGARSPRRQRGWLLLAARLRSVCPLSLDLRVLTVLEQETSAST